MTRAATGWLGLAWLAFALLPWYALPGDGWLDPGWLRRYPDAATAPALLQGVRHGRPWLLLSALPLLLPFLAWRRPKEDPTAATVLVAAGAGGLAWITLQGLTIGHRGWSAAWLANLLGAPGPSQSAFGMGAGLLCLASRDAHAPVRLPRDLLGAGAFETLYGSDPVLDAGDAVLPADGPSFPVWRIT